MNKEHNFKIGNREIGPGNPVFIVAEMSANHNQDFEKAKKIIKAAADCGADAVKLQTYTPETLTIDCAKEHFIVKGSNPDWEGMTIYELYKKAYMPWEWQPKLKKIAEELGIILFSTAYDETAVDFLEKMDVLVYKIASFELTDIALLKKIATTRKPVIISKGMASLEEIEMAISTLRQNGASDIALLHCVSSYPAELEDMNLATITDIAKRFKVVPGLSDHSLGISVPVTSVALGACVIEKHFTLRRNDGGPDNSFSLEPKELRELVKSVREAEKAIGRVCYVPLEKEKANIVARRSLFVVRDVKAGQEFTQKNVRSIRPGYGLAPKFLPEILGKKATKDIEWGTPLSWSLVSGNEPQSIVKSYFGQEGVKLLNILLSQKPKKADAIIILQGDRLDRVKKVKSLYDNNFARQIVITGNNNLIGEGKCIGESDIHLSKIKEYFLANKIPKKAIIIDDQALNTKEQAINMIKLAKGKKWSKLLIVTSPYHLLRAYLTFLKQSIERNWQGNIIMQAADLDWQAIPSGRSKTAMEMLTIEMEKLKKYQKDRAAIKEGIKCIINH